MYDAANFLCTHYPPRKVVKETEGKQSLDKSTVNAHPFHCESMHFAFTQEGNLFMLEVNFVN